MVDFDSLKDKAKDFIEKNEDKIDDNIDKVAESTGKKFGHEDQVDQVAGKLQDMTRGTDEPGR